MVTSSPAPLAQPRWKCMGVHLACIRALVHFQRTRVLHRSAHPGSGSTPGGGSMAACASSPDCRRREGPSPNTSLRTLTALREGTWWRCGRHDASRQPSAPDPWYASHRASIVGPNMLAIRSSWARRSTSGIHAVSSLAHSPCICTLLSCRCRPEPTLSWTTASTCAHRTGLTSIRPGRCVSTAGRKESHASYPSAHSSTRGVARRQPEGGICCTRRSGPVCAPGANCDARSGAPHEFPGGVTWSGCSDGSRQALPRHSRYARSGKPLPIRVFEISIGR